MDITAIQVNDQSFEYWLRVERHYAQREQSYVHQFKFSDAKRMGKRRQRCFMLAIESLLMGVTEGSVEVGVA